MGSAVLDAVDGAVPTAVDVWLAAGQLPTQLSVAEADELSSDVQLPAPIFPQLLLHLQSPLPQVERAPGHLLEEAV